MTLMSVICCCCCRDDDSGSKQTTPAPQNLKKHTPQIIIQEPTPMVVRKPSDVEKVLIGTSEEEIVPVKPVPVAVASSGPRAEHDGEHKQAEQGIESQETPEDDVKKEKKEGELEEETRKENFTKNPYQNNNNNNNNNNVKKTFNRESAKRKVSIPLHLQGAGNVVEQLPVVAQEDLEDNESRKSSMASTQWSWPSDNEERPPIPLKKPPTAGLSVEPGRSVRVSTVVPPPINDPKAEQRGKFTKIPHKDL